MTVDPIGDDLAEFMAADLRVPSVEGGGLFGPPQDAAAANRMLRWRRSLERQRAEFDDRYQQEVRALMAWHADRTSGIDRQLAELERNLEGWMRGQHDLTGVLTEHLPSGELWLRAARRSIVVDDDEKLAVWLRKHPGVDVSVRTKRTVDKASLGDVVSPGDPVEGDAGPEHEFRAARLDDGTVVPGVLIREPSGKTFSVHTSKEHGDVNEH